MIYQIFIASYMIYTRGRPCVIWGNRAHFQRLTKDFVALGPQKPSCSNFCDRLQQNYHSSHFNIIQYRFLHECKHALKTSFSNKLLAPKMHQKGLNQFLSAKERQFLSNSSYFWIAYITSIKRWAPFSH